MFTKITAFLVALGTMIWNFLLPVFDMITCTDTGFGFSIDATETEEELPNLASNINLWEMGKTFINVPEKRDIDIFEFVEYVQLMNCTGGTVSRDLFDNPLDRTVRNDYNFTKLIENCRGIVKLGAKPHLVTGNVPLKLTTNPEGCVFSDNANPPDDYNEYYDYIKAMGDALVEEFGKEELLTWRYGVFTEFENADWFSAKSGDAEETKEAFFKIYDYTVAALQDSIGEDIYIGAHSMTVTEGMWDEADFIRHVAYGTNYATGKTGTRISYLGASFYDIRPEEKTSGKTLEDTIKYLKNTAESCGLYGLEYGIDEGRILAGSTSGREKDDLFSRSVGYTMQGAYDARAYAALLDTGASYLSFWSHLSEGNFRGLPTVSYYVAKQISGYKGLSKASVSISDKGRIRNADIGCRAAVDKDTGALRFFIYNFKYDLDYNRTADVSVDITTSLPDGDYPITIYRINDDCNWFDEWCADREKYGINDDDFSWSPDDGCISMGNEKAMSVYKAQKEFYAECAKLTPEVQEITVRNGHIVWGTTIEANTVAFFEINNG